MLIWVDWLYYLQLVLTWSLSVCDKRNVTTAESPYLKGRFSKGLEGALAMK